MALIKDSNPKNRGKGYYRVFENETLAILISKVQSAVVRAGNNLENIILDEFEKVLLLKEFNLILEDVSNIPEGISLVHKKIIKNSDLGFEDSEPDFIIFSKIYRKITMYIIELKDGDNFDTKKSKLEKKLLKKFSNHIGKCIDISDKKIYLCCFNQSDKKKIVSGFKNKIEESEAMTGKEFCHLLSINYESIINMRKKDRKNNDKYFINQIKKLIPEKKVEDFLISKLKPKERPSIKRKRKSSHAVSDNTVVKKTTIKNRFSELKK